MIKCTKNLSLLFLIFFFIIYLQDTVEAQSYTITDLTSTTFLTDVASWNASSFVTPGVVYTLCDGTYLVGGENILGLTSGAYQMGQYFERVYTGLPTHVYIYFRIMMWTLENWSSDSFELRFGTTVVAGWTMSKSMFDNNMCGVPSKKGETNIMILGKAAHTSTNLDFKFVSKLNEASSTASFGFRDINMLIVKAPAAASTNSACAITTMSSSSSFDCDCSAGKYKNWGSNCVNCPADCLTCFGGSNSQCYECSAGRSWDGTKCFICSTTCLTCWGSGADQCITCKPGLYLFGGNTCITTCDPPLVIYTETQLTCDYPCSPGLFLDWTNNCIAECDFPLQALAVNTPQGPVDTCIYPCTTGEYLYWDGSCQTSCPSPTLQTTTISDEPYCNFTCSNPNPIVYWDGSCNNTCVYPLTYEVNYGKKFCLYPCTDGEYLYNNGTCAATCDTNFNISSVSGELLCTYPCASNKYLYTNGSCLSTCDSRFLAVTLIKEKYCYFPCPASQFLYSNGSCLATCDSGFTSLVLVGEKYCIYSCPATQYQYLNGTCANYCEALFYPRIDSASLKYCDYPCLDTEYLYSNSTCVSYCDPLFTTRVVGSNKFCDYPCGPSQYLYSNGTCLNYCQPNFIHYTYLQDKFCDYPCQDNEYLYDNGTCGLSCDLGFTINIYGYDQFCEYPCQSNEYLYENGTCMSSCPSTYIQWSASPGQFCEYPCSYDEYLFGNGSCQTSCPSYMLSLTYGFDNLCEYPCSGNMFLYENGSCISSCITPFVQEIYGSEQHCKSPCSGLQNYTYWNGTCSLSCPLPFPQTTVGLSKFCNYPCASDQVLNWNGTCIDECKPFLVTKLDGLVPYCASPCTSSQYLFLDKSCVSACNSPYQAENKGLSGNICTFPCDDPDDYYYDETGECKKECSLTPVLLEDGLVKTCTQLDPPVGEFFTYLSSPPNNSATVTLVVLAKPIEYTKYLDINFPPRLGNLNQGQGRTVLSLKYGFVMPTELTSKIYDPKVPLVFQEYPLRSSFLINFWPFLTTFIIILLFAILFQALEIFFQYQGIQDWQNIFERLRVIVKWNLILIIFATNMDDIVFFAYMEFVTFSLDSVVSIVSFVLAIIMAALSLTFLTATYHFASNARAAKFNTEKKNTVTLYSAFLTKWQGFQVMYRGFEGNHASTRLFYLLYVIRRAIPALIGSYMSMAPLAQSSAFLVLSVITVIFLLWTRPIKKKVDLMQILILEILVLIVHVCVLILTIINLFAIGNRSLFLDAGDTILVCNFLINILPLVFLALKVCLVVRHAYIAQKSKTMKSHFIWLQLVFLPLQQGGFGFEQVQVSRFNNDIYKRQNSEDENTETESVRPDYEMTQASPAFSGRIKRRRRQSFEDIRLEGNESPQFHSNIKRKDADEAEVEYANEGNQNSNSRLRYQNSEEKLTAHKILQYIQDKNYQSKDSRRKVYPYSPEIDMTTERLGTEDNFLNSQSMSMRYGTRAEYANNVSSFEPQNIQEPQNQYFVNQNSFSAGEEGLTFRKR